MNGRVLWFSLEKRYGFILADNGESYFIHQNQIAEMLNGEPGPMPNKGDRVSFENRDIAENRARPRNRGSGYSEGG